MSTVARTDLNDAVDDRPFRRPESTEGYPLDAEEREAIEELLAREEQEQQRPAA